MRFEWDENKRRLNLAKHGVDFLDAAEMFNGLNPLLVKLDAKREYGEDSFIGVGFIKGRVMVMVFAEPKPDAVRVVSLRKAKKHEQEEFAKAIRNRLGQN